MTTPSSYKPSTRSGPRALSSSVGCRSPKPCRGTLVLGLCRAHWPARHAEMGHPFRLTHSVDASRAHRPARLWRTPRRTPAKSWRNPGEPPPAIARRNGVWRKGRLVYLVVSVQAPPRTFYPQYCTWWCSNCTTAYTSSAFRQSRGGRSSFQTSVGHIALRERPISACRGGLPAFQGLVEHIVLHDFGEQLSSWNSFGL